MADELDEPVFQHFLTSLAPSLLLPSGRIKVQLLPKRRQMNEEVLGGWRTSAFCQLETLAGEFPAMRENL